MKAARVVFLLCLFCYVQCKKTYAPIDKNANLAFINMEGGGGVKQQQQAPSRPVAPSSPTNPAKPAAPASQPITAKPAVPAPQPITAKPAVPAPQPITSKPVVVPPTPIKPGPTPAKPAQPSPGQIQPKPVNPAPVANPITTPGPGSVKQLINFYDSQGKASPIRPYSYSQAVKQG